MTTLTFYCPACGQSSEMSTWDTYELAPGTELLTCPNCDQRFEVHIQYIPVDGSGHKLIDIKGSKTLGHNE